MIRLSWAHVIPLAAVGPPRHLLAAAAAQR
jgi:hypothetical protein